MLPSSANYSLDPLIKVCDDRSKKIFILGEIQRLAYFIDKENNLGRYPFEISDKITNFIYSKYYLKEEEFIKNNNILVFPAEPFLQMMSWVQHRFGGTSLIDFSRNIYKALYFAIGKPENYDNDSYLYGMEYGWFQTYKNNMTDELENQKVIQYDIYIPSYYKNERIKNQEGMFLYQKIKTDFINKGQDRYHKNIIDIQNDFEAPYLEHSLYKVAAFSDLPETYKVASVILTIKANEKIKLKLCLNSMGITDEFMFGDVRLAKQGKNYD